MLRDIERKILRILWNYSHRHHGYMPSFNELSTKTGKYEKEIRFVLVKLAEQNFIIWDSWSTDTIKIIRGWEDEPLNMPNQSFIGQG
ncbi:hypothetical protein ACYEXS_20170 [Paenibacillus sp. MAH-36]|uniref:hypothetical protein n=1 Tax=Paenibacillus TaxID=44249 RepID=UPI0028FC2CC9|nr:hypothetical protein [Paenibacillus sp. PFR10]